MNELTALAADDVAQALSETAVSFGPIQLDAYTDIIERAIRMVADDPVLRLLHQRMEPVRALASAAVTPTASRP